jgi:hypothetical protein
VVKVVAGPNSSAVGVHVPLEVLDDPVTRVTMQIGVSVVVSEIVTVPVGAMALLPDTVTTKVSVLSEP